MSVTNRQFGVWRPTASIEMARSRQTLHQKIRDVMQSNGVLEVETPFLAHTASLDTHLVSIQVETEGWLQSSPEFHMKRLLGAGFPDIFQISHCFRKGEQGKRHNPEFSMLEWYRLGFSLDEMIEETQKLISTISGIPMGRLTSYREAFIHQTSVDPFKGSTEELLTCLPEGEFPDDLPRSSLLDLIFSTRVEPALGVDSVSGNSVLDVITDFPAQQASLSKVEPDDDGTPVAKRFEGFIRGMEICNGYDELIDPVEQRLRFQAQLEERQALYGDEGLQVDECLVKALEAGIPDCSGVALGLDRLLMCTYDKTSIDEVILFPSARA